MTTKRPKTKTETKTTAGTCPECARALITSKDDPRGRPMCEGVLSGACHYIGAATKPPPAREWGPREDAHLAAVEKWLAAEHRTDAEIEAMLDAGNYERAARTFGQSPLAWQRGRTILQKTLDERGELDKGRAVKRVGDKLKSQHAELTEAATTEPDMLTIRQAADYARVDEKTIRNWLTRRDGDRRMLPGAITTGRIYRIPRTDLDPYRKAQKDTRAPKKHARKHPARKVVKRKS